MQIVVLWNVNKNFEKKILVRNKLNSTWIKFKDVEYVTEHSEVGPWH